MYCISLLLKLQGFLSLGFYSFATIYPGRYDDNGYRPSHIHYKITPVNHLNRPIGESLVTQVYFAGGKCAFIKV